MIIRAKYEGTCRKCDVPIQVGDEIEWTRGEKPYHTECPKLHDGPIYKLSEGQGYCDPRFSGWKTSEVIRNVEARIKRGEPEFLYVLAASREWIDEDGMSFGVGDEEGYIYYATCREATEEEAVPLQARMAAAQEQKQADKKARKLHREIMETGERPEGMNEPEGETVNIEEGRTIYGGGKWFVIGPDWIWAVHNNGHDGDCWDWNNVYTGGAGAIGRRVPFRSPLESEIRTACATAYAGQDYY